MVVGHCGVRYLTYETSSDKILSYVNGNKIHDPRYVQVKKEKFINIFVDRFM